MNLSLRVSHVKKAFSSVLFEDVSLNVQGEAKIALIGDNGSGKSTFLKMLAGKETSPDGSFAWGKDVRLGYLEQELSTDLDTASGGERKMIKLSQLFFGGYNALLLDEPDNHLDLDNRLYFQQLVKDFAGILIVISHDRSFLRTCPEHIWLLEEGTITDYPFNYDKFATVYGDTMAARTHLWEVQEKERKRLEKIVEDLARKAAANDKFAKLYHSTEKRLARFEADMVTKPPEAKTLGLAVQTTKQPARKTAIHLKNLTKSYGENQVLKDLSLHVFCGEKIAIAAPNGSGKSTLLNIISGQLASDSGEVYLGPNLKIGYYTQEHQQSLDENSNLVDEIQKSTPLDHYKAVGYLKKFMFTEPQIKSQVKYLSGGQKSRLQLAKFLSTNPDVLILDEPTNHLDLKTVVALEKFLIDYKGTLVLVSHDQELVDKVVTESYYLENGTLKPSQGIIGPR